MNPAVQKSPNPWLVLGVSLIGTAVGTFGNSMANIAVPAVTGEFDLPLTTGVWVVTLYTLIFSVLMPVCGELGAKYGQRRLYLFGMSLFTIGSLGSGLAPSFPLLLAARALMGIGIAPVLPAVMVIIARTFPAEHRGRAMGYWALVNAGGHAAGPVISGFLIAQLSWRASFLFSVPLCLISLYMVRRLVPADRPESSRPFDYRGAITLTITALGLMLSLTQSARLGWTSPLGVGLWMVTLLALGTFLWVERRTPDPFVELRLFANRGYTAAIAAISAESFILFGLLIAIPVYLIQVQGWDSQVVGLVSMSLTLIMALSGPGAGRFSDLRGSRLACTLGLGLIVAGGVGLYFSNPGVNQPVVAWALICGLAVIGLGMGLIQSPATAAAIHVVRDEQVGVATGIFHMVRFISGALGSTAFGMILENDLGGKAAGFYHSLWAVIAVAGVAFTLALWLPGRNGHVSRVELQSHQI